MVRGYGSGVVVDLNILPEHDSDNILTIRSTGIKILEERDHYLSIAFWSAKHQAAVYLRGYGANTINITVIAPGKYDIWMWTRAKGAKVWDSVVQSKKVTAWGPMTESLDGKWFCFAGVGGSGDYSRYIYLVSYPSKHEEWVKTDMENGRDDGEFFMLDENTFFKSGIDAQHVRTKLFDRRTGKSSDSTIPGELEQFVEFKGEPWALRHLNGKYDVVKVSRHLDKVEKSFPIPTDKI